MATISIIIFYTNFYITKYLLILLKLLLNIFLKIIKKEQRLFMFINTYIVFILHQMVILNFFLFWIFIRDIFLVNISHQYIY